MTPIVSPRHIRSDEILPPVNEPPHRTNNHNPSHQQHAPVHVRGTCLLRSRPEEEERREDGVDDGKDIDGRAPAAELEGTVGDVLAAPAFDEAEDDRDDLRGLVGIAPRF